MGYGHYATPHRGLPRALERGILKYRAMQMVLILFYAEHLRARIVQAVETQARFSRAFADDQVTTPVPPGPPPSQKQSKQLDRALKALVADEVINGAEVVEIKELLGFRHTVAHEVHNLTADLSNEKFARSLHEYGELTPFDYEAASKLEDWVRILGERLRARQWVQTAHFERITFRAAEKTLKAELKRLSSVVDRLMEKRRAETNSINQEFDLRETELVGDYDPRHPYAQYDDGRLTKIGVEICYRLFAMGKSNLAVAHLLEISLKAVQHRRRMWGSIGGIKREPIELASIPRRKFYRRYDD